MIQIIEQDLFQCNAEAYMHVSNCFCRMANGVAAGMVKYYPEAVAVDAATEPGDRNKLGSFSVARARNGKYIYNLYGQYNYGTDTRKVNYEALYTALESARNDCISKNIKSIALPYNMGSGLAGGNWNIVYVMIQEIFKNFPGTVTICRI